MKITKFGHACLLVEEQGVRFLIDPGNYSAEQNYVENIDVVLITHEHQDHVFMDSLKEILKNNTKAKVITNTAVGELLKKEDLSFTVLEDGQSVNERGVLVEAFGNDHALIYKGIHVAQNTGYFIGNKFFYPGDAFTNPGKHIEILALPVVAPWMAVKEGIDYALTLKPEICLPVHDGILKNPDMVHRLPAIILQQHGINFISLEIGKEYEF